MTRSRFPHRALVLAACAVMLAGCSSKADRIESGLRKGAEFVAASDWDKASVETRNVLQIDPKQSRAYLLAAKVAEGQGNPAQAFAAYQKAVELQPDLREAQVGLARVYLFGSQLDKAQALIDAVLAAEPSNAGARTLRAALMHRRGQSTEALAEAQAILQAHPRLPAELALLMGGIHASKGRPDAALQVIDQALQTEPRNTSLLQVAAQLSAGPAATPAGAARAADYYRRATQALPKDGALWRAWAGFHLQRNEPDKVEAVLRDAVAAAPQDGQRRIELLAFVARRSGLTAAEVEYQAAVKAAPRDTALRFAMAQTYRGFNRHDDARRVYSDIVKLEASPESVQAANGQLAVYRLAAGQVGEARSMVEALLKTNPRDATALMLRGRIHLVDAKPRDAVADLRAALRDQPGSPELAQLLTVAHRAAGEPQLAREVLSDAVKFRPNDADLRLLLAADYADAKDTKAALAEADAALRVAPLLVRAYDLKSQLQLGAGDVAGAEKTLAELKARAPEQAIGHLMLGRLQAGRQRVDAALKEFDGGAAVAPSDPAPYAAAVALLIRHKRFDEADKRIVQRLAGDAKNVLHHQLRGDVAMARRDFAAAERAYRECIQLAPAAAVGYVNTAKALAAQGRTDDALAQLKQGEASAPTEMAIPIERAEMLARTARYDEAIALYEELHKRQPDHDTVTNNLAYLLAEVRADRSSTERALQLALRFVESRDANQLDSLGWIHYRLGQYDRAVPLLERAVASAPPTPLLQLHLGQALVKVGQVARGKEYLRKAIDSKRDLPRLDEARAMLAQG